MAGRVALTIGGIAAVGFIAGCTSSGTSAQGSLTGSAVETSAPTTTTSTAPSSAVATTAPPSSAAPTTSSAAPTSSPASTTAPSTAPPATSAPVYTPLCASPSIKVSALRGSGAEQQQYATISVTNAGANPCWLVGYAGVSLLAGGKTLGKPATPASGVKAALQMPPNGHASASLHGTSNCEAGVSDTARITLPGQSAHTDVFLPMRGCALTIDAFQASQI